MEEMERPDDEGDKGLVRYWRTEINLATKREERWRKSAKDVLKRYRGDFGTEALEKLSRGPKFNILYSNTEVLRPALYSRTPTPDIRPRWNDTPIPAVKGAARVLERGTLYTMDVYDFDGMMSNLIVDYVLPGRAVARVRYEPQGKGPLDYPKVCYETVNWEDFRHGAGRTWDEVTWVAFKHLKTRDEAKELWGPKAKGLKLDHSPDDIDGRDEMMDPLKRVTVWEVWNKNKREIAFLAIDGGNDVVLDRVTDDPLRLDQFFPVPRPLLSIESTHTLEPEPEFYQYKSLADELEEITARIQALVKAIKARGGYNGILGTDLSQILGAAENDLVPLENATALASTGSKLSDSIWMWPIETLVNVVENLYKRRADVIQSIYEVTGISDVLRGSTDPNETATAQNIKAQFGSQRLNRRQREVQRFVRDLLRLGCEIMGAQFEPQALTAMTGIPVDPQMMQILRSDVGMSFVIDIETDSTISEDLLLSTQRAGEFVTGMGSFLQAIMPLVQTGAMPQTAAVEMVKSYAQRFKMGKGVEDAIDQMGQQQPPQGPSKEQLEAQAKEKELALKDKEITGKLGIEGQKVQIEQQRLMLDAQTAAKAQQREDARFNIDAEGLNHQRAMDSERLNFERENSEKSREFEGQKFAFTKRSHELGRRDAMGGNPDFAPDMLEEDMKNMEAILQAFQTSQAEQTQQFMAGIQAMMQQLAQGQQQLAAAMLAPKQIVYENGRPVGSRPMGTMQ